MAFYSQVGQTITIDYQKYTFTKCLRLSQRSIIYILTPCQQNRPELVAKQFFNKEQFQNELQILSSCYHDSIISVKEYRGMRKKQCIIFEKIDFGDLVDFVNFDRAKYPSPKLITSIFYRILEGIAHIHQRGYAHIDIKPDNILIKKNGRVKIIDFEHSVNCNEADIAYGGTEWYQSPELAKSECVNSKAADIFSLGVVFLALMFKYNFFQDFYFSHYKEDENLFWKLHKDRGINSDFLKNDFKNLIKSMLSEDPNDRPTIEEVMKNKIITNNLLSNEDYAFEITQAMTPLEDI